MIIGWRARIGQIRPASAIEGAEEWRRVAPEGVAFIDARTIVEEVTDKGLQSLAACKGLTTLNLNSKMKVTAAGVDKLKKALPSLNVVMK